MEANDKEDRIVRSGTQLIRDLDWSPVQYVRLPSKADRGNVTLSSATSQVLQYYIDLLDRSVGHFVLVDTVASLNFVGTTYKSIAVVGRVRNQSGNGRVKS